MSAEEHRLDELERWRGEMERRFAEAFPGGDHVGHCRYHELMIEDIAARKRLRQAVVEKTIGGLVWAMIVGFAIMSWDWLVAAVKRAIH